MLHNILHMEGILTEVITFGRPYHGIGTAKPMHLKLVISYFLYFCQYLIVKWLVLRLIYLINLYNQDTSFLHSTQSSSQLTNPGYPILYVTRVVVEVG